MDGETQLSLRDEQATGETGQIPMQHLGQSGARRGEQRERAVNQRVLQHGVQQGGRAAR